MGGNREKMIETQGARIASISCLATTGSDVLVEGDTDINKQPFPGF